MQISIIIVSYNAKFYLQLCLQSVIKSLQGIEGEILVVDNASSDGTIQELEKDFPQVKFIYSSKNLGFSKANNFGVKSAQGEWVLILNPDCFVPEDLLRKLLPFARRINNLGAIGTKLINGNGMYHQESKRNIPSMQNTFDKMFGFLLNKKTRSYYQNQSLNNKNTKTKVLVGAFMLMKKKVFLSVNGFDEDFFMYGEDIDFSVRLLREGYENYYFGESTVIHFKGKSTTKNFAYLKNFYGSMHIYLKKHYRTNWIKFTLLSLGIYLRFALTLILQKTQKRDKPISIRKKDLIYYKSTVVEDGGDFVLSTKNLTNKEIIQTIEENYDQKNRFFIHEESVKIFVGNDWIIPE